MATNRLLGLGLSRAELEERGSRLGSDVPFCLRGGTAVGTGRGEELATLLRARTPQHVVVALADGIDPRARGEQLTTADYVAIAEAARELGIGPGPGPA